MELLLFVLAFGAIVAWYSWNKSTTSKFESKADFAPKPVVEEPKPEPLPPAQPLPEVVEPAPAPAPAKTRGRKPAAKTKPAVKTTAKTSKAAKATTTKKK
jgi:hypothetical protein